MKLLNQTEIKELMAHLSEWKQMDQAIFKTFIFKDFSGAIRFVNEVTQAAEKANHHPDIDIRWKKVKLLLTTYDSGGLTTKDFDLATIIDQLFQPA